MDVGWREGEKRQVRGGPRIRAASLSRSISAELRKCIDARIARTDKAKGPGRPRETGRRVEADRKRFGWWLRISKSDIVNVGCGTWYKVQKAKAHRLLSVCS
jgi:plasmid stability protein